MGKVRGLGGVFYKVRDPAATRAWYAEHLGLTTDDFGTTFMWREPDGTGPDGFSVWSPFKSDTDYFAPSQQPFMINLLVEGLDSMLDKLRAKGVEIVGTQDEPYGRFAWIVDPDGVKIELWEPAGA